MSALADDVRLKILSKDVSDIKKSISQMADAITTMAVLEQKHYGLSEAVKRAHSRIDAAEAKTEALDERLRLIEVELPVVRMASGWVFKAALGVLAILGTAALAVIIAAIKGGII